MSTRDAVKRLTLLHASQKLSPVACSLSAAVQHSQHATITSRLAVSLLPCDGLRGALAAGPWAWLLQRWAHLGQFVECLRVKACQRWLITELGGRHKFDTREGEGVVAQQRSKHARDGRNALCSGSVHVQRVALLILVVTDLKRTCT